MSGLLILFFLIVISGVVFNYLDNKYGMKVEDYPECVKKALGIDKSKKEKEKD